MSHLLTVFTHFQGLFSLQFCPQGTPVTTCKGSSESWEDWIFQVWLLCQQLQPGILIQMGRMGGSGPDQ